MMMMKRLQRNQLKHYTAKRFFALNPARDVTKQYERTVDLRSDTMTSPCDEMRSAMSAASVGDDVWGEDPTVIALEKRMANIFNKESGLFVPSGTMGNLISVASHTSRGDEIILGDRCHIHVYEAGGVSVLMSVTQKTLPTQDDGTIKIEDIENAIRADDPHFPKTRLVALENTHNYCGGKVLKTEYVDQVGELCKKHNLILHIDGARIFNAAAASGDSVERLTREADSVSVCLSKGLGAPVGSVIVGTSEFVARGRRLRKLLGGGMRQAGVLAEAGMFALDHNVERLVEDHENARMLAEGLASFDEIDLNPLDVESNIIYFAVHKHSGIDGPSLLQSLERHGVLIGGGYSNGLGFRAVTHGDMTSEDIQYTLDVFESCLSEGRVAAA